MSVRVNRIYLKNVFGVEQLDFDPDGVTILKGRNGSGKTSVIRAIHRLIEGGSHPDMLKKGEEDGHVVLELSDGSEVEASLTEKGTYYHLRGRDDVTARQLIRDLVDEVSVNPVTILNARSKDRGQILLEATPMSVDEKEVKAALDPLNQKVRDELWPDIPPLDGHALDVLGDNSSGVIGVLADERQSLYGAKRDKQGTVNDLEDSVGSEVADPDALRERRDEVNEKLRETKREKGEKLEEIDDWKEKEIKKIRREAEERKEQVRHDYEGDLDKLKEERAKLQERIEQAERQQQTLDTIEKRKAELEDLETRYSSFTDAIENLRTLKTSYRADLPEDVEIRDGEIYDTDEVPFENWNEERKIRFACMIAEMRMGDLQIIPVDGIEKLVGEQRELFLEWAEQSPAQFILTEAVAGQDLTVEYPGREDEDEYVALDRDQGLAVKKDDLDDDLFDTEEEGEDDAEADEQTEEDGEDDDIDEDEIPF